MNESCNDNAMSITLKIFLYLMISLLGAFAGALILVIALQAGFIDALPPDEHLAKFKTVYMGGGLMAAFAGIALGLGCFFTSKRLMAFFLSLPVLVPALYSVAALIHFAKF